MDKSAIAVLIIGLFIIWLLSSSIGALIRINEEQGAPGGLGSLLPRIKLPQPPITLPPINITIPQHINETRAEEVYVPLVPIPVIMPNIPISIANYLSVSPLKPSPINAGGYSGGSGVQGGTGHIQSSSNAVTVSLRIAPLLLIMVLVLTVIVVSMSVAIITKRGIEVKRPIGAQSQGQLIYEHDKKKVNNDETKTSPVSLKLLPGEVVKPLRGWGGSAILNLEIPKDLPLIWSTDAPLSMVTQDNYSVSVSKPGEFKDGRLYMPFTGCYKVQVRSGEYEETLFIRASDYREDVINFVRLNIGDFNLNSSLTIREILSKLVDEGAILDKKSIDNVVRIFEEVKYGLREVNRTKYESFLRALGSAFRNAMVIVCEGPQ
ncbi:MAG: DUF4129 domain-containing protein [Vulcanisaeta sp.]